MNLSGHVVLFCFWSSFPSMWPNTAQNEGTHALTRGKFACSFISFMATASNRAFNFRNPRYSFRTPYFADTSRKDPFEGLPSSPERPRGKTSGDSRRDFSHPRVSLCRPSRTCARIRVGRAEREAIPKSEVYRVVTLMKHSHLTGALFHPRISARNPWDSWDNSLFFSPDPTVSNDNHFSKRYWNFANFVIIAAADCDKFTLPCRIFLEYVEMTTMSNATSGKKRESVCYDRNEWNIERKRKR